MTRLKDLSADDRRAVAYRITDLFVRVPPERPRTADQVVVLARERYDIEISREQVYVLLRESISNRLVMLVPPRNLIIERQIGAFPNQGQVHVVEFSSNEGIREDIAFAGAQVVARIIREKIKTSGLPQIHLGLGVGSTTARVCKYLAALLRQEFRLKTLFIHALTPAFSPHARENPLSWLSYFFEVVPQVEFIGLNAEPIVTANELKQVRKHPLVKAALEMRHRIDIVLTSMASRQDEHGYLNLYAHHPGLPREPLHVAGGNWVGDVQLLPFSNSGPVKFGRGMVPVTLFELEELCAMRQRGTRIVLLCAPCGECGKYKTDALAPLLTNESLHVWSDLVLDRGSGEDLIRSTLAGRPDASQGAP